MLNQYSALHMGFLPLFYVVIAYLATLVSSDMIDNNWLLAVVLGFTLSGLFELLVLLSFWFGGHNLFTLDYLSQIVLVRVLLNTTFMLLLFPVLRALNSNLNQRHKALLP